MSTAEYAIAEMIAGVAKSVSTTSNEFHSSALEFFSLRSLVVLELQFWSLDGDKSKCVTIEHSAIRDHQFHSKFFRAKKRSFHEPISKTDFLGELELQSFRHHHKVSTFRRSSSEMNNIPSTPSDRRICNRHELPFLVVSPDRWFAKLSLHFGSPVKYSSRA